MNTSPGDEIRRALRVLVAATVLLYLVVGTLAVLNYHDNGVTSDALCTLRGDLETRVKASEKYLRETPNAIKGISPAQIKEGIDNQKRTIEALSDLSCG